MIDPIEASAWVATAKTVVETLKSAWSLLPKGADKDALAHKIEEAEKVLNKSDVKLAKERGYKLCECTFPPQIMLWKESEKLYVCPNQDCGRTMPMGMHISDELLRFASQKPRGQS